MQLGGKSDKDNNEAIPRRHLQIQRHANRRVVEKIRGLPESGESVKLFSYVINTMNKWLGWIEKWPGREEMNWWLPVHSVDELEARWDECLQRWVALIESRAEEQLDEELLFIGLDGYDIAVVLKDIALQMNYHSIHHCAQIQYLIRQQGIEPDFIDYIGTRYRILKRPDTAN